MSRTNLIQAREIAGLSQSQLAETLDVTQQMISSWESGKVKPTPFYRKKINDILSNADPTTLFDIYDTPGSVKDILEMLRREFMGWIAKIGGTSVLGNTSLALVSTPVIEPAEYIEHARVAIADCWENLNRGALNNVERALNVHMPTLRRIATTINPYQHIAATLGVQACIMRVLLATRDMDYLGRESHCVQAVQFGALSGDRRLLSAALFWQGDTYTYCYNRPQRAIAIFNDALSYLDNDASLDKAHIYIDMAIAHAQDKDETKKHDNEKLARDHIEMARITMPSQVALPPLYQPIIRIGHSELDQFEGKAYLYLAEHFPNADYGQWAYDLLDKSTKSATQGFKCQALIRKADAARVLGEKDYCMDSLEQALSLTSSQRRFNEINDVLQRVPEKWQRSTKVQALHKDLTHAMLSLN